MISCGVYFIRNRVNGKMYIGSSVTVKSRLNKHQNLLRRGCHPNEYLQRAFKLHGAEAFEFGTLEECAPDDRLILEQGWIDRQSSEKEEFGYNLIPTRESQLYGAALSVHQRKGWAAHSKEKRREIAKHLLDPVMKKKAQALANVARATESHKLKRQAIAARTIATDDMRRKAAEALRRKWQEPEFRAARLAGLARGRDKTNARLKTDAAYREKAMVIFSEGRRKAKENADRRKALRDEIVSSAANEEVAGVG